MKQRKKNQLLALEMELFPRRSSVQKKQLVKVKKAAHYDHGMAIELTYGDALFPETVQSMSYQSGDNMMDEIFADADYEVESFQNEPPEKILPGSKHPEATEEREVVRNDSPTSEPENPGVLPVKQATQPIAEQVNDSGTLIDPAVTEKVAMDDAAFEEDLRQIIRRKNDQASTDEAPASAMENSQPIQQDSRYGIFDQLGKQLSFANTYDLGSIALNDDNETAASVSFSENVALDEMDIAEDFAAIEQLQAEIEPSDIFPSNAFEDAPATVKVPIMDIKKSVGKGGVNDATDVAALKERLIDLGFDWLKKDSTVDADTIKAIKLFQAIKNGRRSVSGADGLVEVGKGTYQWLQAVNAPRWQIMPAGSKAEGYENFEIADTNDNHDYGTSWLVQTIQGAGKDYKTDYLDKNPGNALITINDSSLPKGWDTPDHKGHETGLDCDIRLPYKDGSAKGGLTYKDVDKYDQDAMRAMLKAFQKQPLVKSILFNDPVLIKEKLCTAADKDHDNHAHVSVEPPAKGSAVYK